MFLIRDMACNHYSDKDMFVSFRKTYVYDLSILMLLLIPRTWCLMKRMEMLLLWNVMQNKKFQYDVKYEMFSGYVLW